MIMPDGQESGPRGYFEFGHLLRSHVILSVLYFGLVRTSK